MSKLSLSGVLLVDKPAGITSADVTNQLKKKFRFERIGHGGTLDPFATGLLVVLLGEATKTARFLLEGDKTYEALAILGTETDTGDPTGQVVQASEPPLHTAAEWNSLAAPLRGLIRQRPPVYSALKVKGRPLYDYARKGEEVEIKEREVIVRQLEVTAADKSSFRFTTTCSGGTYIRVLAADLARLGGGLAHLRELRRTGSSSFRVENAKPLEELLGLEPEALPLRGLVDALAHLPKVYCNDFEAEKVRQGNLAVFNHMRPRLEKPGYFLLVIEATGAPVAIANHNPMMIPFCSIERVFDPRQVQS